MRDPGLRTDLRNGMAFIAAGLAQSVINTRTNDIARARRVSQQQQGKTVRPTRYRDGEFLTLRP